MKPVGIIKKWYLIFMYLCAFKKSRHPDTSHNDNEHPFKTQYHETRSYCLSHFHALSSHHRTGAAHSGCPSHGGVSGRQSAVSHCRTALQLELPSRRPGCAADQLPHHRGLHRRKCAGQRRRPLGQQDDPVRPHVAHPLPRQRTGQSRPSILEGDHHGDLPSGDGCDEPDWAP